MSGRIWGGEACAVGATNIWLCVVGSISTAVVSARQTLRHGHEPDLPILCLHSQTIYKGSRGVSP